ncbi:VanZ like family protein [Maioricimonas rarisocia]|uniref:VanZ like family protein n=2 Tax=Maioricimonas rarisocia TaxID=2528026 RepID=A0A517Z0R6_9PLAN|nr:VanZ like family protein [Maioricimonas rarisocia]
MGRGRTIARIASIAYAVLLGGLLLATDPFGMLGASGTSLQAASKTTPGSMLQHLTAYILLPPLLYAAAWQKHAPMRAAIVIALAHGLILEWLQQFVPGRYADWYDVLANAAGVAIGVVAVSAFVGAGGTTQPN